MNYCKTNQTISNFPFSKEWNSADTLNLLNPCKSREIIVMGILDVYIRMKGLFFCPDTYYYFSWAPALPPLRLVLQFLFLLKLKLKTFSEIFCDFGGRIALSQKLFVLLLKHFLFVLLQVRVLLGFVTSHFHEKIQDFLNQILYL